MSISDLIGENEGSGCLKMFFESINALKFEDAPDYSKLKSHLQKCIQHIGET